MRSALLLACLCFPPPTGAVAAPRGTSPAATVGVASLASDAARAAREDLRALAPDLARVAATDEAGAPLVDDARLARLEERLGAWLALPPELAVALTAADGARREVLADDEVHLDVARRADGLRLFDLFVALDGERVHRPQLRFCDPLGADPRTRAIVEHRNLRYHPLERLPWLFRRIQELLETLDARGARVLELVPVDGWLQATPPAPECGYDVAYGPGERRRVRGITLLPLGPVRDAAGELLVPLDRDGRPIERLARGLRRTPAVALDEAEQVLAGLARLRVEHRVVLQQRSYEGPGWTLDVDRPDAPRDARRVAFAYVRRDAAGAWQVGEWTGKREERRVPLARFAALTDRALRLASGRGETLAALAAFASEDPRVSEVLAVTTPSVPAWDATRACAHVLRAEGDGPALTVDTAPLVGFADVSPHVFHREMRGRAREGRVLSFATSSSTCGTELDPWPLARFGEREAELLGGAALGDREDPRDRR